MFKEIARKIGTTFDRERFVHVSSFAIPDGTDIYWGQYNFKAPSWDSQIIVTSLTIDVDVDNFTAESPKVENVLDKLKSLNVPYNLYFSGSKGYHIVVPNVWDFNDKDVRSSTVKYTLLDLFPDIDSTVFHAKALIRIPNTVNSKSGLYKILVPEELVIDPYQVLDLAKEKGDILPVPKTSVKLEKKYALHKPLVQVSKPDTVYSPICINSILSNNPVKGQRHITLLRVISHLVHYLHLPQQSVLAVAEEWINRSDNDIKPEEINRLYKDVSEKYRFGCNDPVLASMCSNKCRYYLGRNYMGDYVDIRQTFDEYMRKINNKEYIDLHEIYPEFIENEFIVFNTDLIGIVGAPGAGKSTMAVDMAMRHLATKEEAHILLQNLDNSHELAIRRMIQWYTSYSKETILRPQGVEKYEIAKALDFIEKRVTIVQDDDVDALDELVSDYEKQLPKKPTMVIVDHVGNLNCKYNGYDKMKYLGDALKAIAKRYKIIVVAIGHIRKQDARENIITSESARDANLGSASDLLIGVSFKDSDYLTSNRRENDSTSEVIISSAKSRDNPPFLFECRYNPDKSKFEKKDAQYD